MYAIDSGIPLKGFHRRAGAFSDVYSGLWDAANEDLIAPASGCGNHSLKNDVALAWKGRNQLAPVLSVDDLADCPTGPTIGFDFDGVPAVSEVVGRVGESKFGRTRQFSVRGTKAWTGSIAPINRTDPDDSYVRSGDKTVRWSWEATFRKVVRKRGLARRT
jgi:hypothetical protein